MKIAANDKELTGNEHFAFNYVIGEGPAYSWHLLRIYTVVI